MNDKENHRKKQAGGMLPERQAEKAVGTVTPSRVGWTEITTHMADWVTLGRRKGLERREQSQTYRRNMSGSATQKFLTFSHFSTP